MYVIIVHTSIKNDCVVAYLFGGNGVGIHKKREKEKERKSIMLVLT